MLFVSWQIKKEILIPETLLWLRVICVYFYYRTFVNAFFYLSTHWWIHWFPTCVWYYFVIICSGLTAIATYLLTKELWNDRAGLLAACFIAIGKIFISVNIHMKSLLPKTSTWNVKKNELNINLFSIAIMVLNYVELTLYQFEGVVCRIISFLEIFVVCICFSLCTLSFTLSRVYSVSVPGYISRSVAGSYDNEGIAIFALQFTYFLWVCYIYFLAIYYP